MLTAPLNLTSISTLFTRNACFYITKFPQLLNFTDQTFWQLLERQSLLLFRQPHLTPRLKKNYYPRFFRRLPINKRQQFKPTHLVRFLEVLQQQKRLLGPSYSRLFSISFVPFKTRKISHHTELGPFALKLQMLLKLVARIKKLKLRRKRLTFKFKKFRRFRRRLSVRPYLFLTKARIKLRQYRGLPRLLAKWIRSRRFKKQVRTQAWLSLNASFFYGLLQTQSKELRQSKRSDYKQITTAYWGLERPGLYSNLQLKRPLSWRLRRRKVRRKKRIFFFGSRYLKLLTLRRVRSQLLHRRGALAFRYILKKVAVFSKRRPKRRRFITTFQNSYLRNRVLLSIRNWQTTFPNSPFLLRAKLQLTSLPELWAASPVLAKNKPSSKSIMMQPLFTKTFRLPIYGLFFLTHRQLSFTRALRLSIKVSTYSFISTTDFKRFLLYKSTPAPITPKLFTIRKTTRRSPNAPTSLAFSAETPNATDFYQPSSALQTRPLGTKKKATFPIKRIRFKPGYSKIWRAARSCLKSLLLLKFLYQKQLTRFLIQFYNVKNISLLSFHELRVLNVLAATKLVPDLSTTAFLISHSLLFVNGVLCTNAQFILAQGDVLQLLVSIKFYILFKWLKTWLLQKKNKIRRFRRTKQKKLWRRESTLLTTRFPKWILDLFFFDSDTPKYLETDYFSLSAVMLYDPFLLIDFNPLLWQMSKKKVLNMYNWKYLN